MRPYESERSERRLKLIAVALVVWSLLLAGRLVQLQILRHDRFKADVLEQNQNIRKIPARRGTIYDRRGRILARSLPARSVFLSPAAKESRDALRRAVADLAGVLSLSRDERSRIEARIDKGDRFIWVKRKIDEPAARAVEALRLPGVFLQEETKRSYPQGRLAAHVLGFVNVDEKGQHGVEKTFDEALEGEAGRSLILRDARRRAYHLEVLQRAVPGRDLELTIDETIQYETQRALARAVESHGASWGAALVSHPATGEILALASYPDFDPNLASPAADAEPNRAVSVLFDPGSTFKIVTAAAALENGAVGAGDRFDCSDGAVALSGNFVRDHKVFGILSFADVFSHSSNVGMIQVGTRLERDEFYAAVRAFGFGGRTGVDLPGEVAGIVHPPSRWAANDQAYQAIGYGVSVTALQVLQAVNVIANDGVLTPPRIVRDASGSAGAGARAVLPAPVARQIRELMRRVVEEGTGTAARIPGYPIAGKTGTAQKLDPVLKRYTSLRHLASFAGFVDSRPSAFSMVVVIDDPRGDDQYGGLVAAPVFREVARRILRHFRIPPAPAEPPVLTAALDAGGRR
jgi:cell division protein FtsI (penicillin-binding protein 3)